MTCYYVYWGFMVGCVIHTGCTSFEASCPSEARAFMYAENPMVVIYRVCWMDGLTYRVILHSTPKAP